MDTNETAEQDDKPDVELCIYCLEHPADPDHYPYCSGECGLLAELEGE